MDTKIVKIGKKSFTIKKLNFGEVNEILDQATSYDKSLIPRVSMRKQRMLTIKLAVTKPELTEKQIESMSANDGIKLYFAIGEHNSVPLPESPEQSSNTKE